uniref:TPR_REGION domain-containing protein n=1 Tax=Macrostomum lignano TaxID=282301 RepID=A0A1I8F8U1_9PLAT
MDDKAGEAKASGNLGNTLKVLGKFEEAGHMGEARALYNLGNVHHAHGKHAGRSSSSSASSAADQAAASAADDVAAGASAVAVADVGDASLASPVRQALPDYYAQNLAIVRELGDRAGVGRACGNLGNTHYLLGNFHEAIRYHTERLAIAKEFGDRDYHARHMRIAEQLGDRRVGEARACWSLGQRTRRLRRLEVQLPQTTAAAVARPVGKDDDDDDGLMFDRRRRRRRQQRRWATPAACESASDNSGLDDGAGAAGEAAHDNQDLFLDLISRCQGRRMDEQRCSAPYMAPLLRALRQPPPQLRRFNVANQASQQQQQQMEEAFFGYAGRSSRLPHERPARQSANISRLRPSRNRMLLQRQPPPQQQQPPAAAAASSSSRNADKENVLPDDAFFDMLMRCQATRLARAANGVAASGLVESHCSDYDDVFGQMVRQSQQKQQQQQQTQQERPGSRLFSKFSLKKTQAMNFSGP